MMQPEADCGLARRRELVLLEACRDLAEELSLIDIADYVCLLRSANLITLGDLVSSSIEPFFQNGTVTFACSGDYRLGWSEPPLISLDFELLHEGVFAFFRIVLWEDGPDVELNHISFDPGGETPAENTAQLESALRSARLA